MEQMRGVTSKLANTRFETGLLLLEYIIKQ